MDEAFFNQGGQDAQGRGLVQRRLCGNAGQALGRLTRKRAQNGANLFDGP